MANGPNQVWAWDITYLPTRVRGRFLKLYVVIDVWSQMIVGAVVHETEDPALAAQLIEATCKAQGVSPGQLVLHAERHLLERPGLLDVGRDRGLRVQRLRVDGDLIGARSVLAPSPNLCLLRHLRSGRLTLV